MSDIVMTKRPPITQETMAAYRATLKRRAEEEQQERVRVFELLDGLLGESRPTAQSAG